MKIKNYYFGKDMAIIFALTGLVMVIKSEWAASGCFFIAASIIWRTRQWLWYKTAGETAGVSK